MSSDLPTKKDLVKWDQEDALNWTREEYEIPNSKACGGGAGRQSSNLYAHNAQNRPDGKAIYFCGNSLGLLNKKARQHIMEELDVWSTR